MFATVGTVSLPSTTLPHDITEDWFSSLPLLDSLGPNAVHYVGTELLSALKQLQIVMDREDPQEEFKVSGQGQV